MHNDVHSLIVEAEIEAFDQSRFDELQAELQDPVYLEDVETDLYTREMLPQIPVSDAVRKACTAEMFDAHANGWRLQR